MADEAIFIGYRRDDTADVAGRIYDAMAQRFGRARIFKDVDNIGPGVDFGEYIRSVLPRCRVALVLIGPNWLHSKDENGNRRLADGHDWVRIEIETALATPGVLVVPVLVNGARMPRSEDVPEQVRPLLRRNAAIIRRDPDFHDDVERLASAIGASVSTGVFDFSRIGERKPRVASAQAKSSAQPLLWSLLPAALSIGALLIWQPWRPGPSSVQEPAPAPEAAVRGSVAGSWTYDQRWSDGSDDAGSAVFADDGSVRMQSNDGGPAKFGVWTQSEESVSIILTNSALQSRNDINCQLSGVGMSCTDRYRDPQNDFSAVALTLVRDDVRR